MLEAILNKFGKFIILFSLASRCWTVHADQRADLGEANTVEWGNGIIDLRGEADGSRPKKLDFDFMASIANASAAAASAVFATDATEHRAPDAARRMAIACRYVGGIRLRQVKGRAIGLETIDLTASRNAATNWHARANSDRGESHCRNYQKEVEVESSSLPRKANSDTAEEPAAD